MSEWELRLLLMLIGIIILVVIYVLGSKKRPPETHDLSDDKERGIEPIKGSLVAESKLPEANTEELGDQVRQLDKMVREEAEFRSSQCPELRVSRSAPLPRSGKGTKSLDQNIIILHVAAKSPNVFGGTELLKAFSDVGLEYDKSQIFYRYTQRFSEKRILFGVVNIVNPGTFDLDRMKDLRTPGVSLFLRLPAPVESLKAFNIMLDCAQTLATFLHAEVHDESHSAITKQTIDHMREEIQLHSLRHGQLKKA